MECTKFACDHDGDILEFQTTTTYDAFGNVVSVVIEQNVTNYLTEDADSWCFDGLEMDVDDDALKYHQARFYDPAQGRWLNLEPLGFDNSRQPLPLPIG